jgi:hypothetical protein
LDQTSPQLRNRGNRRRPKHAASGQLKYVML